MMNSRSNVGNVATPKKLQSVSKDSSQDGSDSYYDDEEEEVKQINTGNSRQRQDQFSGKRVGTTGNDSSFKDSLEGPYQQSYKKVPSFKFEQTLLAPSTDNNIQLRNSARQDREGRYQQPKVDSERSQCTQESVSAAESHEGGGGYSARISRRSMHQSSSDGAGNQMARIIEDYPPQNKSDLSRKMLHFRSLDGMTAEIDGASNEELEHMIQIRQMEQRLREELEEEEKEIGSGITESPQKDSIYGSFQAQKTSGFPTHNISETVQQRFRKQSNPASNQLSAQHSQNVQSTEYNYSPDFRDSSSLPHDQQSDGFSPALPQYKNTSIEKQTPLDYDQPRTAYNDQERLLLQQNALLKYEEFEGDCYTSSSQHKPDGGAGQVFFSGGTHNYSSAYHATGGMIELHRGHSERMSDRIYEKGVADHTSSQNRDEDPFSFYNHCEDDSSPTQPALGVAQSPYYQDRKMPPQLSIISEEDTYHDHQSYQSKVQRMISQGLMQHPELQKRQNSNDFMFKLNQSQEDEGAPQFNKSKSQPMSGKAGKKGGYPGISPMNTSGAPGSHPINTSGIDNPEGPLNASHKNTISSLSQYIAAQGGPFPYHKSNSHITDEGSAQRRSHELQDDSLMRVYTQGQNLRQSANNPGSYINYPVLSGGGTQQDYALISDEDLLSNMGGQSKPIAMNDCISDDDNAKVDIYGKQLTPHSAAKVGHIAFDENSLIQKIREQSVIIETLRNESSDQRQEIQEKNAMLLELQIKNDELTYEIYKLTQPREMEQRSDLVLHSNEDLEFTMVLRKKDAEIQVNLRKESASKKSGIKKRKFSSNAKQTPSRVPSEYGFQDYPHDSSKSSFIRDYETPQVKKGTSIQESPMNNMQFLMQRSQYAQMIDEINSLSSQVQSLKILLQNIQNQHNHDEAKIKEYVEFIAQQEVQLKESQQILDGQRAINSELQNENQRLVQKGDGHKADLAEKQAALKAALEELKLFKDRYGEYRETVARSTSATSLQPFVCDQDVQTDLTSSNMMGAQTNRSHLKSPSLQSMYQREQSFPHTIPLPEVTSTGDQMPDNHYSTFSSRAGATVQQHVPPASNAGHQNITIINNKHELSLLEQEREYQLRAMRVQNEINEHRNRLLKEKQDLLDFNLEQKEEFKKKLKRREARIDKYRNQNRQLTKDVSDLKLKLDEMQHKVYNVRLKLERTIQEKEFKIQMLKTQIKAMQTLQVPQNAATPGGASGVNQNANHSQGDMQRQPSQTELYNMINSIIQNQMMNGPQQFEQSQRPRSQEHNTQRGFAQQKQKSERKSPLNTPPVQVELHRDDSSQLIIPPQFSVRESNDQYQRRFESTLAIPIGGMMSPPLGIQYNPYIPRSVPRSIYQNSYLSNVEPAREFSNLYQRQSKSPAVLVEDHDQRNQSDYVFRPQPPIAIKSESRRKESTSSKRETSRQKVALKESIQKKADKIQMSRNKERSGGIQKEMLKSTLSDGDFMQRKRTLNKEVLERDTLQKICTTEVSILVDERIEDSRKRVQEESQKHQQEERNSTSMNGVYCPSLKMDQVPSRRDNSSYHSATFRHVSTNQHNSPQKNLQTQFDQAKSPVFIDRSQHFKGLHVISNMTSPIELEQYSQYESSTNQQQQQQHYQLVPEFQTLSGQSQDRKYLKNLRIREKQSRSRQSKNNSNSHVKADSTDNKYGSSIIDSLNEEKPQATNTFKREYQSQSQKTLLEKPPLSSKHGGRGFEVQTYFQKGGMTIQEESKREGGATIDSAQTNTLQNYLTIGKRGSHSNTNSSLEQLAHKYEKPMYSDTEMMAIDQQVSSKKLEDIRLKYGRVNY